MKPRTHERVTRNNVPRQLPAIVKDPHHVEFKERRLQRLDNPTKAPIITVTQPTSSRLPLHSPNIIDLNAVNHLTEKVYYRENKIWYPGEFSTSTLNAQNSDYDCDIEHMCAGVTHPVTGEHITKY